MIVMQPDLLGDKNVKCDRELIREVSTINELWFLLKMIEKVVVTESDLERGQGVGG